MNLKLLKIARFFHLIDKASYNLKRQIEMIRQSGLFDEDWYFEMYPEAKEKGLPAIEHYVLYGWKEDKDPNENFDGKAYLKEIPELKTKNWSPLFHYILEHKKYLKPICSKKEFWRFIINASLKVKDKLRYLGASDDYILVAKSKLFDKKWYLKNYPDVIKKSKDPLRYYLHFGWKEGQNPCQVFNTTEYQNLNMDQTTELMCPLVHYLKHKQLQDDEKTNFPPQTIETSKQFIKKSNGGRTVVFAAFSPDGKIPETTLFYLKELHKVSETIIYISDNPVYATEVKKLKNLVSYCAFLRHGENEFGSYKRGYLWAKNKGLLEKTTELIFCNDSCYGPVYPLNEMFKSMSAKKADFWGITAHKSKATKIHLQSYFLVFKRQVFTSSVFDRFMTSIKKEKNNWSVMLKYENRLNTTLSAAGFSFQSYIPYEQGSTEYPYMFKNDLLYFPRYLLAHKSPLIKAKCLDKNLYCNYEGINNTIDCIRKIQPKLGALLEKYKIPFKNISFSVIMPTYNRKNIIDASIHSALNQAFQNFELIIVDDGSTDGTSQYLQQKYAKEIKTGKIKYYHQPKSGVCRARNCGLEHASNEWIAYLDSDNIVYPHFLETFARLISDYPQQKTFYTQGIKLLSRHVLGKPYNPQQLIEGNYIDLGMFVHHKSVYQELKGFDEKMTRLVDWELIIRYTNKYSPYFLKEPTLIYNDANDRERISNSENWVENYQYLCKKHHQKTIKTVSVVVPIYNALDDVKILLQSLATNFNFSLGDVLLIDDCSKEETKQYLKAWCQKDKRFTLLENQKNLGFIKTCNRGMKIASGDIICLLNSDTEIPQGFCEKILRCFITNSNFGVASPIGSDTLEYCIPLPSDKTLADMNKIILHYHGPSYPRIPSAEGFCFCIRKEVIKKQGYLEEKFGKGYHEEVDYSYRALKNGWQNVLIHDLYVYHKRQASFGETQREQLIAQNTPLFMKRWKGFREKYVAENHLTNPMIQIKQDLAEYLPADTAL